QWHKRLIESFPELLSRAPDPRYFGLRRQSAAATAFWIASRALWSRRPHTYPSCKNNFRVFRIVPQRDRDLAQNPKSKTRNPKQTRRTEIRIAKPGGLAPFRALELFRILNLFRISDSGLRISRASNAGWPGVLIPPASLILFLHRS